MIMNIVQFILTISDFIKPNKVVLKNTYCNPHFFDPKVQMKHIRHIRHMKLNDKKYMIKENINFKSKFKLS